MYIHPICLNQKIEAQKRVTKFILLSFNDKNHSILLFFITALHDRGGIETDF